MTRRPVYNTRMPLLRRIVFYLFLLIYLVCCPVTILYALGYVLEPGTVHGVLKTGLISLVTVPPGAAVSVGGRHYGDATPTVIRGLLPGEYGLKLALKNHRPWVRVVPVEVEKATVLEKIVLLPDRPAPREVLAGPFTDLVPIPGTRFILLVKGRSLEDIVVYDREADDGWALIPAASAFLGGQIAWHLMLRDSPFLLFKVAFPAGIKFLGIELIKGRARLTDLSSLFMSQPQRVMWDARAAHQLFSLHDYTVDRLDTDGMALYPQVATQVRGMGVHDGMLYLVQDGGALQRMDPDGKHAEALTADPAADHVLAEARGPLQITGLASNLVIVVSDEGELFLNRVPYRFVAAGVRGFEFDPEHDRVVVWLRDRLGVLDLSTVSGKDAALAQALRVRWAFQGGSNIAQAFWAYDGSHILFRDGATVLLLEEETYGPPACNELLRVKEGTSIAYAEQTGQLHYIDSRSGSLNVLEIIPGKESRFLRRPANAMDNRHKAKADR